MITRADIFVRIATQGLIGFGIAPGTVATMMMIPMVYFLGNLGLPLVYHVLLCGVFVLCGAYVVQRALPVFNYCDSSAIVLDEMVAFLLVFLAIPVNAFTIILGFGLFRLLDIIKPFGITYFEKLPGCLGVMADDIAAACLSNLILHFFVYMGVL